MSVGWRACALRWCCRHVPHRAVCHAPLTPCCAATTHWPPPPPPPPPPDGLHINFLLRPGSTGASVPATSLPSTSGSSGSGSGSGSRSSGGSSSQRGQQQQQQQQQPAKVMFSTVRPIDYSMPYATLEANNVSFSAVDKRGNRLLTVVVRRAGGLRGARGCKLCWGARGRCRPAAWHRCGSAARLLCIPR
jgi:hypothetical protein